MLSVKFDTALFTGKGQMFELPSELIANSEFLSCYFNFSNTFLNAKELAEAFNSFINHNIIDLSIFLRPQALSNSSAVLVSFSDKKIAL